MYNYSVCIASYNSASYIERTLERIMEIFSGKEFEIVVVDNFSNDGSMEYIRDRTSSLGDKVKILQEKSNRGEARQLAYKMSTGKYIISNIDLDVLYSTQLKDALGEYHGRFEGKCLSVYGMMIIPAGLAKELGGWRPLNRHEDNDLAIRAFGSGMHAQDMHLNVVERDLGRETKRHGISRIRETYFHYLDWFRLGMKYRNIGFREKINPIAMMAKTIAIASRERGYPYIDDFLKIWDGGGIYNENNPSKVEKQ